MDKRNDIARWLFLALICGAGSTGGALLRPHNPAITTQEWIKMQLDVQALREGVTELRGEMRTLADRLAQRQP